MADRPQYHPLHDTQLTNLTPVQTSPFIANGYPVNLPVPSADHNGKFNSLGDWSAYCDQGTIRNSDWLASASADVSTLAQTDLTYADGGNITTTGGTVATRGVYMFEGVRLETDDALLNPIGQSSTGSPLKLSGSLTLPGRVWVYVSSAGVLRITSVGGAVADTPAADELTLVGHAVDLLGVLNGGPIAPITKPLPAYALQVAATVSIDSGALMALLVTSTNGIGTSSINNTGGGVALLVEGNGAPGFPSLQVNNNGGGPTASFTGTSPVSTTAFVNTNAGSAATFDGNGGAGFASVAATNSGAGAGIQSDVSNGAPAIIATGSGGASPGLQATGDDTGAGVEATGGANAVAVLGTSVSLLPGVRGIGSNNSTSSGVEGIAVHLNASGSTGQSAANGASSAAGVKATGFNNASGISAIADDGYAGLFRNDLTNPARAAIHIAPQDADPTIPLPGDFQFNTSRASNGKYRGHHTTLPISFHSSPKGGLSVFGASASGTVISGGATGNLSIVQIDAEEIGSVQVTATVSLDMSTDTTLTKIFLIDVTAGVTINGFGGGINVRANDIDSGATGGRDTTSITSVPYTLPAAGLRQFAVVISSQNGATDYLHAMTGVIGVQ